ncbi:Transposase [Shigella dysenteriae 1617]|uniref:Transposase n=1 Tax=Shigella dysenteriae 1617 TaxID=754093 RepID=A0A0A6ZSF8_SHIDY|nr:Transposase [Shigella dysenteriae 1617]AHA64849.1 Transposase [Shigella dysenteriae 1617]
MAVTAAKSVMAFRVLTMAVDLCRLTTRTMNVNAGHERTSKARIIHQIQLIRGITMIKHLTGKIFTQRIERNNLTLRTRIKRLARKTICFSRSVEIHEKVIGTFIEKHMFY